MQLLIHFWLITPLMGVTWAAAVDNKLDIYRKSENAELGIRPNTQTRDRHQEQRRILRMIGTNGKLENGMPIPSHEATYNKMANSFVYVSPNTPIVIPGHQEPPKVNDMMDTVTESMKANTEATQISDEGDNASPIDGAASPTALDAKLVTNTMDTMMPTIPSAVDDIREHTPLNSPKTIESSVIPTMNSMAPVNPSSLNANDENTTTVLVTPTSMESSGVTFTENSITNINSIDRHQMITSTPTSMEVIETIMEPLPSAEVSIKEELPDTMKATADQPTSTSIIMPSSPNGPLDIVPTTMQMVTTMPNAEPIEMTRLEPSTNMPRTFATNHDDSDSTDSVISDMIKTIKASKAANAHSTSALNAVVSTTPMPSLSSKSSMETTGTETEMAMSATMDLKVTSMDSMSSSTMLTKTDIDVNVNMPSMDSTISSSVESSQMPQKETMALDIEPDVMTTKFTMSDEDSSILVVDAKPVLNVKPEPTEKPMATTSIETLSIEATPQTDIIPSDTQSDPTNDIMLSDEAHSMDEIAIEATKPIIPTIEERSQVAMTSMSSIMNRPPPRSSDDDSDPMVAMDGPIMAMDDPDAVPSTMKTSSSSADTKLQTDNKPKKGAAVAARGSRLAIILTSLLCLVSSASA